MMSGGCTGRGTRGGAAVWAVLAMVASMAGLAAADVWPVLRRGQWEFVRTIETPGAPGKPKVVTTTECTDPVEDMTQQNAMLSKSGCRFTPVVKAGNTYTFSAECTMPGYSGRSKSVMTVESDSAYTVNVESTSGADTTREVLRARRTGDCR